eukprot:3080098-Pyramimonas_sp.AAC.1
MHIICASGGTAQINCNELCLTLLQKGVTLEALDAFQRQLLADQKIVRKLPLRLFQDRVVNAHGHHMKLFAGECLTVVTVLATFARGSLDVECPHRRCIQVLSDLCDLLTAGDDAVPKTTQLATLLWQHHSLMLNTYGEA